MYAEEISTSRFVELCLGVVVRNNNLTPRTHTHTHHSPSKLHLQLFSLHHSQFTRDILAASLWQSETDQTFFSAVTSTDRHHYFHCIVYEEEFRLYTWYFLRQRKSN